MRPAAGSTAWAFALQAWTRVGPRILSNPAMFGPGFCLDGNSRTIEPYRQDGRQRCARGRARGRTILALRALTFELNGEAAADEADLRQERVESPEAPAVADQARRGVHTFEASVGEPRERCVDDLLAVRVEG